MTINKTHPTLVNWSKVTQGHVTGYGGHFRIPEADFDFIIVEKEENLVEEDENPPNEPEPIPPKPTTTNTGSSLVIPEDAKSSSNVENSRNSMKVNSTENTNHRLR